MIPSLTDSYESWLMAQAFDVSASQAFLVKRGDAKKEEEETIVNVVTCITFYQQ